jgi:hypothetical protein
MPLYFGFVGEIAAGKSTAARLLREMFGSEFSIGHYSSGDVLREILTHGHFEPSRENLQASVLRLQQQRGEDFLTREMERRMMLDDSDIVIFDGVRQDSDTELLEGFPNSKLIYITAGPLLRYHRDDNRRIAAGQPRISIERFNELCSAPTEQRIGPIGESVGPEMTIKNNRKMGKFQRALFDFFHEHLKTVL